MKSFTAALAIARDGIELAFVTALQALPPRQTAALVLCDVLEFDTREVATMLDVSPTAVKGLLQRACARMPARTQSAPVDRETAVARRLADAYLAGRARGLLVVTARPDGQKISSPVRLLDDDVHTWFDLPAHLPSANAWSGPC